MIKIEVSEESKRALLIKLSNVEAGAKRQLTRGISAAIIFLASSIKRDYLSGQLVNRRTGNLSRAVFSNMESDLTGVVGVGAEAPYARYVNDGTAPHVIMPVRAKALRFENSAGAVIFARRVNHPGIKARHFMETALRENRPKIIEILQQHVSQFKENS